MAYRWPAGTSCQRIDGDVQDRSCPVCGRDRPVCAHRSPPLWTLQGPTQGVNRLVRCPDASGASRGGTCSPEAASSIRMPRGWLGWEVVCWLGPRRVARHGSVPQLRAACKDPHQSRWSDEAIAHSMGRDPTMLAARQQDPAPRVEASRDLASWVLTSDGWPPAKGHETLEVVRERMRQRVWLAAAWLSRATPEGRRVIVVARQWAERLDQPGRGWRSEQQEACVTAMASECPGTPHRDGSHHFLRAVAPPVLEMARRAQVTMRRKVRGGRALDRRVLEAHRPAAAPAPTPADERSKTEAPPRGGDGWGHDGGRARARRGGRGRARVWGSGAGYAARQPGRSASPARWTDA